MSSRSPVIAICCRQLLSHRGRRYVSAKMPARAAAIPGPTMGEALVALCQIATAKTTIRTFHAKPKSPRTGRPTVASIRHGVDRKAI